MAKKARRSARNAATATKNFGKWLPKAVENFFEQIPPTMKRIKPWAVTFKGGLTLLCLLGVLVLVPLFLNNEFVLGIFISANILVIFAASWDLLAGFAGESSFGHALFLGMGGYVSASLVVYSGQPWWIAMFIGAIFAVVFGLIIGIPCLRLRGPYFSLGTLAFSLLFYYIFQSRAITEFFGIPGHISAVPLLVNNHLIEYLVVLLVMIVSLLAMLAISNSRVGTVFKAIRDDEISADAAGINTTKYKLVALVISSFFAGIAGSLYAFHTQAIGSEQFGTLYSFYPIVMASLGGIATIFGSLGGAYFFQFVFELFRGFSDISYLIFAVAMILVIRFASGGVIRPLIERVRQFWDILRGK